MRSMVLSVAASAQTDDNRPPITGEGLLLLIGAALVVLLYVMYRGRSRR
jgi:hypothetical protein